jgi:N-acetylglucosaminyl-diphospho-decaprenol L-rhamnosyltransferase
LVDPLAASPELRLGPGEIVDPMGAGREMLTDIEVPIVIVGFRNPQDVVTCLKAIGTQRGAPKFQVFVCENGGSSAFEALETALLEAEEPGPSGAETMNTAPGDFVRVRRLRLAGFQAPVVIGEAGENFGYAGGANAWIRPFLAEKGWTAVWILNPDTLPEPDALAALVDYAKRRNKGMIGSRLMMPGRSDVAWSRGLKWNKWSVKLTALDVLAPISPAPDPEDVETRMDSPTGCSMYVTRECIERVGLMDESFFLYWEETDWGVRAKPACGVGYAHNSVVSHVGGTTTGAVRKRSERSALAVYLPYRNQLHFVRRHHPGWFAWRCSCPFCEPVNFSPSGRRAISSPRFRGWRPDCEARLEDRIISSSVSTGKNKLCPQ